MTFTRRYWASLTGRDGVSSHPERGRTGYSLGRRYLAALLGISLPTRPTDASGTKWVLSGDLMDPAPPATRLRRKWAIATGLAVTAAFGVGSIIGVTVMRPSQIVSDPPYQYHQTSKETQQTSEDVPVEFDSLEAVPQCATITGTGTEPVEDVAVLLVNAVDHYAISHTTPLDFDGDRWQANVMVGTAQDIGREFTLSIYAIPPEDEDEEGDYLAEFGTLLAETTVTRTAEVC